MNLEMSFERSARKEFPNRFFCDSPPHRAQMRRALGTPGRAGAESKDPYRGRIEWRRMAQQQIGDYMQS